MKLPWSKEKTKGSGSATATPSGGAGWSSPGSFFSGNGSSAKSSYDRPPEFDIEYANEDHLRVFQKALNAVEDPEEPSIEHIRSVSDFAPIRERVKRSSKKGIDVVREGWAWHVSRWPLLVSYTVESKDYTNLCAHCLLLPHSTTTFVNQLVIFLLIGFEFLSYVFVRQLVNIIEFFFGCMCVLYLSYKLLLTC
jgi:hypothetical protein